MEISRRYRVNVGTSVKGVKSYDCTVELRDSGEEVGELAPPERIREMMLQESDALVAELDKRYPPPEEGK